MTSKGSIQICHSDASLVAEISFWAKSASYELVTLEKRADLLHGAPGNLAAVILELSGSSDEEVDVIEALTKKSHARVMAITQLDAKTVGSLRRLFQAKSPDVILLARADFNTRQLADLLKPRDGGQRPLDREGLAQAIAGGHLVVHYQPKVPFRPGETDFGVEALCRINHPQMGMIYPDNFIPLAEAHDLILELTDTVTVQAFRDLKIWDEAGRSLRMAINISPRLMSSMTWFELFEHRCQEHKVDPKRITLEVTESSSQGGKVLALEILSRLRLKGFLLSIDDFGTGFSSLETLYKLPFGELKIDKGFVFDLLKNSEARTLVESTVSLARKLGLKIVAEGVETDELFQELRGLHCDDAQGYFISKPIAADAILPFFARWESDSFARANSPANRLKAVHGLLADILSGSDDDDDATVVLTSMPRAGETSRDIAARVPALVMSGDMIGSLAMVHKAVKADGDSDFRGKLLALQCELERSLLESALFLSDGRQSVQMLGGESFTIGRESPSAPADVTIPCRWLSRGAKNLRLYRDQGRWMVADLGSTNGHFLNGTRLKMNEGVPLGEGETVLEVGKSGSAPAPAWLRFQIGRSGAVQLSFGTTDNEDQADGAPQKWMLLPQDIASRSADATVMSDSGDFSNVIWRNGGLWVVPRAGASIQLAGHEFSQSLPLPVGYEVKFGSTAWRAEKTRPVLSKPALSVSSTAYA